MMSSFNPLLCADFYRAFNFLELPPDPSPSDVWMAATKTAMYFSSFCKDSGLPVDAVRCFFGVEEPCVSHEQAALMGARNITMAYFTDDLSAANDG
jgi:hypothetical protein